MAENKWVFVGWKGKPYKWTCNWWRGPPCGGNEFWVQRPTLQKQTSNHVASPPTYPVALWSGLINHWVYLNKAFIKPLVLLFLRWGRLTSHNQTRCFFSIGGEHAPKNWRLRVPKRKLDEDGIFPLFSGANLALVSGSVILGGSSQVVRRVIPPLIRDPYKV